MSKPANKPRKKATGYKMPLPLPIGLIVQDLSKKQWKLGPSIGKGGFGEIYSAQEVSSTSKTYPFVIKIEPHANGPLFVEMHFYMRVAKSADVNAFKTEKKLNSFGMPEYLGSGSHEYNGEKYRFLVMHKFGSDLWKLFLENNRRFPTDTVFKLGIQILDVLEYIHSKGYIHGDIKAANVLLGLGKEASSQVYLVDFGLCTRYSNTYKPDPKKAHNGTIEYLSRDAHIGVESRRGDLEILGYNLTQWLGCILPWETHSPNPVAVQNSKQKYMENLADFFKICFKNSSPPADLITFFKYITGLKFETVPDYEKIRQILQTGIEASGGSLKSPLKFKFKEGTSSKGRLSKSVSPVKKPKVANTKSKSTNGNLAKKEVSVKIITSPKHSKRNGIQDCSEEEEENPANSSTYGFTAEMIRIKDKLKAKKPPTANVDTSSGDRRKRNIVNYKENSFRSSNSQELNDSVLIISNSESEEEVVPRKRRILRK